MISKVTHIELDLKAFPFTIKAYAEKALVHKWEFTNEAESKEALNGIWNEVLKTKIGEANGNS